MGLTASVILAIKQYGWDIHVWDLPPKDMVTSRKVSHYEIYCSTETPL